MLAEEGKKGVRWLEKGLWLKDEEYAGFALGHPLHDLYYTDPHLSLLLGGYVALAYRKGKSDGLFERGVGTSGGGESC